MFFNGYIHFPLIDGVTSRLRLNQIQMSMLKKKLFELYERRRDELGSAIKK